MPPYHRTQIQLEKAQYERLKRRAAEEDISLSELIRRIVDRELGEQRGTDREKLREMRGIFADEGFSARDHDEVLYGDGDEG